MGAMVIVWVIRRRIIVLFPVFIIKIPPDKIICKSVVIIINTIFITRIKYPHSIYKLQDMAVAISIFVGTQYERQTLLGLSELVDEGTAIGMPVLAVTAVGKELEKRDARYLSLCCRIAAELGAHFVKTYFCEDFEKVTSSCPVPCVIAGGPKLETEMDAFEMTRQALEQGAVGVDMGRNIWQHDHALAMIKAVRAMIHGGATTSEAKEIFDQTVAEGG